MRVGRRKGRRGGCHVAAICLRPAQGEFRDAAHKVAAGRCLAQRGVRELDRTLMVVHAIRTQRAQRRYLPEQLDALGLGPLRAPSGR